MTTWRALLLVVVIGSRYVAHAQSVVLSSWHQYNAAFLSTGNAFADVQKLIVFPIEGEAFSVSLPLVVAPFAFTGDGKTLYGAVNSLKTLAGTERLSRIQFNPTRTSPVAGSSRLTQVYSVAVSQHQDKLVVVAGLKEKLGCGIIELSLLDGSLKEIVFDASCQPSDAPSHWEYLNLSPDGKRATAYRRHMLEMIDLASGTIQRLGERFMEAAWSPDGNWLAALEASRTGRTILMDPNTLEARRSLPRSQCQWSPDSLYILQDHGGTLQAIEVATGRTKVIVSSKDKVAEVSTAWVSSEIRP
jgi:WD40 repeat protein